LEHKVYSAIVTVKICHWNGRGKISGEWWRLETQSFCCVVHFITETLLGMKTLFWVFGRTKSSFVWRRTDIDEIRTKRLSSRWYVAFATL